MQRGQHIRQSPTTNSRDPRSHTHLRHTRPTIPQRQTPPPRTNILLNPTFPLLCARGPLPLPHLPRNRRLVLGEPSHRDAPPHTVDFNLHRHLWLFPRGQGISDKLPRGDIDCVRVARQRDADDCVWLRRGVAWDAVVVGRRSAVVAA